MTTRKRHLPEQVVRKLMAPSITAGSYREDVTMAGQRQEPKVVALDAGESLNVAAPA